MFRNSFLKQFLFSGSVYAATLVTSTESDQGAKDGQGGKGTSGDCDPCTGKLLRRSELPLYDEGPVDISTIEDKPSNLEKNISAVRKELWVLHDKYTGYREKIVDVIETGKAHSSVLVDQLRKDELPIPRSGAIAIGGLTGVVLGLRGGWFKRIIYGSTCAGLMTAVCYPQEAKEFSQEALATTKKYIQITHNFIYGVKPESFKLPSPSQLLGGAIEVADKEKGDKKTSAPAVSEEKPEALKPEAPVSVKPVDPCDQITFPDLPEQHEADLPKKLDESPGSKECDCKCHSHPGYSCPAHKETKVELDSNHASPSQFDQLAEESADVVYWGFRLK